MPVMDFIRREWACNRRNGLVQIKAADETVLANYAYDALGRRINKSGQLRI